MAALVNFVKVLSKNIKNKELSCNLFYKACQIIYNLTFTTRILRTKVHFFKNWLNRAPLPVTLVTDYRHF